MISNEIGIEKNVEKYHSPPPPPTNTQIVTILVYMKKQTRSGVQTKPACAALQTP